MDREMAALAAQHLAEVYVEACENIEKQASERRIAASGGLGMAQSVLEAARGPSRFKHLGALGPIFEKYAGDSKKSLLGNPYATIGGGLAAGLLGGLGHYAIDGSGSRDLLHSLMGGAALGTLAGTSAYAMPKLINTMSENLKTPSLEEMRRHGVKPRGALSRIEGYLNAIPGGRGLLPGAIMGGASAVLPNQKAIRDTGAALHAAIADTGKSPEGIKALRTMLSTAQRHKFDPTAPEMKNVFKVLGAAGGEGPQLGNAISAQHAYNEAKRFGLSDKGGIKGLAGEAAIGAGLLVGRNLADQHGGWLGTAGRVAADAGMGMRYLGRIPQASSLATRIAEAAPVLRKMPRLGPLIPLALAGAGIGQGYNFIRDKKWF